MKVVIIAPGYAPAPGGVETHVTGLARGLAARGVEVEVWVPDRHCRSVCTQRDGAVVVRRFPSTSSTRFPIAPQLYRYVRRHLDSSAVVHVHGYHNAAAASVLLAKGRVPFVFTPHFHGGGHTQLASLLHVLYRPVGSCLFARAGAVVAVSAAEAELIREAYPKVRPAVIWNGVDAQQIAAAAPLPDEPPTVLVLGRLERYKRVGCVLAAFDRTTVPGQVVVVGDGLDRSRLESMVRSMRRASDVRFLGAIPRTEVDSWLRTAHGVVSMSGREAFGLVGLESAAAGGLAVLSDIPAHREVSGIVDPGVISLCAPVPADLVPQLDRVLRTPPGAPRAVRDWSAVAAEYLETYRTVVTMSRDAHVAHERTRP